MAGNLLTLARKFERRAAKLRENASQASVNVALAIVKELVNETPVDSSQALSNWQVALGSAVQFSIDPYYTGVRGSTQELSAVAAIAAAQMTLKGKKPGQDIIISNVLPYIRRLNEGYSPQAKAGFIEAAIMAGKSAARRQTVGKA